jgi:hypothetical protein
MPSPKPAAPLAAKIQQAIQRNYEIAQRLGVRLPGTAGAK